MGVAGCGSFPDLVGCRAGADPGAQSVRAQRPVNGRKWRSGAGRRGAPCTYGARGAGSSGAGAGSGDDEAFIERALQEAAELVRRAQDLAEQQARAELMQSWAADGGAGGASGQGRPAPAAPEAVAAFLEEQGLSRDRASRLAPVLIDAVTGSAGESGGGGSASAGEGTSSSGSGSGDSGGGGGGPSLAQLQAKWLALQRVLPDADLAEMVAREPGLLSASSGNLVAAMVALVQAFPSRDVLAMAQGRPGLLLMRDLPERCERVVAKLLQLHPSRDREVVAGLIEENPELLVRMDYYLDARLLDELPVEIQNMMIPPGDQGIGWLYRHYGQKRQ